MDLNKRNCLREELEQLSTEQLKTLLHTELDRNKLDGDRIRLLTGILNERHSQRDEPVTSEMLEAWEQYQKDCAADDAMLKALEKKKSRKLGRYIGRAAVAAVLVIACLGFFTVPKVSGQSNFLDFITRWTDNVFAIFGPSNADEIEEQEYVFQTDNPGLQEVYDEVTGMGITYPVVPMRLLDEAELVELKTEHTPTKTKIHARFVMRETEIILEYCLYGTDELREYSWDTSDVKKYEHDGITHDIVSNEGIWVAVWSRENLECSIAVDCQEDVLYDILESIYTMEDD